MHEEQEGTHNGWVEQPAVFSLTPGGLPLTGGQDLPQSSSTIGKGTGWFCHPILGAGIRLINHCVPKLDMGKCPATQPLGRQTLVGCPDPQMGALTPFLSSDMG